MTRYLDQTATATAIVVAILLTDHLFSPIGTTVKQLAFSRPQLVQKPCALSLHVPALLLPDSAKGSRVIFPSGVKVIRRRRYIDAPNISLEPHGASSGGSIGHVG